MSKLKMIILNEEQFNDLTNDIDWWAFKGTPSIYKTLSVGFDNLEDAPDYTEPTCPKCIIKMSGVGKDEYACPQCGAWLDCDPTCSKPRGWQALIQAYNKPVEEYLPKFMPTPFDYGSVVEKMIEDFRPICFKEDKVPKVCNMSSANNFSDMSVCMTCKWRSRE